MQSQFEQNVVEIMSDMGSMMSYLDERGYSYRLIDDASEMIDHLIVRTKSALRNEAQEVSSRILSDMLSFVENKEFGTE